MISCRSECSLSRAIRRQSLQFIRSLCRNTSIRPPIEHSQTVPIEQLAESLRSVSLDDPLPPAHSTEVEHDVGELLDGLVAALEASIDDVDAIGGGLLDVLLHEAAEAAQIGRHGGNAHHCALGRGVAPRLVVRGEHPEMAATHKVLIVQTDQGRDRREEFCNSHELNRKQKRNIVSLVFGNIPQSVQNVHWCITQPVMIIFIDKC